MIKVTSKILSDMMFEKFNKIVTYVGRESGKNHKITKPIKFAFFEWDKDGKFYGLVLIKESYILKLIQQKNE